ncbi:MAG: flagellar biosynthesis protein FlgN [Glaciihabitans sp.]|nr:flagellar biosynthesis protein FlgN [Glaciihabitans sp.]
MGMHELSALLWRERDLLEVLLFKLEVEQLLLTAGKTRWLPRASKETEQVSAAIRDLGLARTVEVSAVAHEWGAPEESTIADLIEKSPEPVWADILDSHLSGFTELVAQIQVARDQNLALLREANRSTQETIAGLSLDADGTPGTYNASGSAATRSDLSRLLDEEG